MAAKNPMQVEGKKDSKSMVNQLKAALDLERTRRELAELELAKLQNGRIYQLEMEIKSLKEERAEVSERLDALLNNFVGGSK